MGKCTERDQRRRLRALPCFSCRQPCTSPFFHALPHNPCRKTCTSPNSLQLVVPLPCTSRESLRPPESVPCTSLLFIQQAVHFARFLAGAQFCARKAGRCTSKSPPEACFGVHFRRFLAARRALRPIPCTSSQQCKDSGEVHGIARESRGSAWPLGHRPPVLSCTSPKLCNLTQGPSPRRVVRPRG